MFNDFIARTAAVLVAFSLSLRLQPALSQGLPPDIQASSPSSQNAEAPQQAVAPAQPADDAIQVSPGPLEEQRKKLLDTIMTAKGFGFGIAAYINAFKALDGEVKSGADEKTIKGRLDSIVSGLDEQLKRSQQLKVQRPAPPISASSPPPSSMSGGGQFSGGGGNTDALIDKIKNKWFGGEIPDSIKKKLPANFDPSMLDSDQARELLKKYTGGK
ncbi:MAG: hypothetical protein K2X93_25125 [Candidatus Obscuribacterales bacterium]|nr:hypothetical protein [Candidatus Obscuribacterales bacterium]